MKFLGVHPGPLMYTKVFLRLEPLGLELVAAAVRAAGHDARLIDLQVEGHRDYHRLVRRWRPDVIAFSCNYLANVPEIVDLAKATKRYLPGCYIAVGGHSASFTARAILDHGEGAIDCVLKGEGEAGMPPLLDAIARGANADVAVPGAVTAAGEGPAPGFVQNLDAVQPARDLLRHRRKYFIGVLDPCASIEFSRGCPWDCAFCSAWTFYGRSYRLRRPDAIVDELAAIAEPGVFIVDDVAFVHEEHGMKIGEAIARRHIDKRYYLETRGDVLLRNKRVFEFWRGIGLKYVFLGLEAIDEEGLRKYRKRTSLGVNFEALEFARSLGLTVAINIIADPDWDERRFAVVREWCMSVPEVVNISVNTPYPGTETWHTEARDLATRDYRLFDIQHAVLPTRLPLDRFYAELINTQRVLNRKHMNGRNLRSAARLVSRLVLRGQTNFARSMLKYNSIYNPAHLLADHRLPVAYELPAPPPPQTKVPRERLFVHRARERAPRALDATTEQFVDGG
jgi:magnesium-protoporphyrin IX monomethyl ester (oxidative) cyclase